MTSYCVSITEQKTAKCYLFVKHLLFFIYILTIDVAITESIAQTCDKTNLGMLIYGMGSCLYTECIKKSRQI